MSIPIVTRSETPGQPRLSNNPLELPLVRDATVFDPQEFVGARRRRVFFLTPPGNVAMNYGRLGAAATELPWLGMAHIASATRSAGHEVLLEDYEVRRRGYEDVARDIARVRPDVIAMALFINNVDRCLQVARIAKGIDPGIRIVLGGPQATIFPEQTIDDPSVDALTISEAEIPFCRYLAAFDDEDALSRVPGIWFKTRSGEVVQNPRQPLIQNLDSLPPPALDLYPMDLYYPAIHIRGRRVANYVTARGCPYECTFCAAKMTFGRTFRFHSPERVIHDLNELSGRYGYDSFQFYDDIFTTDRKRVIALCEAMIANGSRYRWMCFTRTNLVDPELCRIMKAAGCYLIVFGCESGNAAILKLLRKGLTVEQNYEGIRIAREAGIQTLSSFMLGLPTESREQSEDTIRFALRSGLDYAVFPVFEPYAGTEIWDDAVKHGRWVEPGEHRNLLLPDHEKVWIPEGRERPEIEQTSRQAFRRFYLRPSMLRVWLRNAPHMPFRRLLRFVWSGLFYFLFAPLFSGVDRYRGRGSRYA